MRLGELIERLRAEPERIIKNGFGSPHSYRGSYEHLAFQPEKDAPISQMLRAAESALGKTYSGYKGGDYEMGEWTECYLADYGSTGDELNMWALTAMLSDPEASQLAVAKAALISARTCCHEEYLASTDIAAEAMCSKIADRITDLIHDAGPSEILEQLEQSAYMAGAKAALEMAREEAGFLRLTVDDVLRRMRMNEAGVGEQDIAETMPPKPGEV